MRIPKTMGRNRAMDTWAEAQGLTVTERTGPDFRCDASPQVYTIRKGGNGWEVSKKVSV